MTTSKLKRITISAGEKFTFAKNSKIYKTEADDNSNVTITFLEFGNNEAYQRECEILSYKLGENFEAWLAEFLCEKDDTCYFLNVI
jgi:hypothetical protein